MPPFLIGLVAKVGKHVYPFIIIGFLAVIMWGGYQHIKYLKLEIKGISEANDAFVERMESIAAGQATLKEALGERNKAHEEENKQLINDIQGILTAPGDDCLDSLPPPGLRDMELDQ